MAPRRLRGRRLVLAVAGIFLWRGRFVGDNQEPGELELGLSSDEAAVIGLSCFDAKIFWRNGER
jgi:hypothetical protein